MSVTESQIIDTKELPAIIKPFAENDFAHYRTVGQSNLDDLRSLYQAEQHVDFQRSSYYIEDDTTSARSGALLHLPFRLALGLHTSVKDRGIDEAATISTYATYIKTQTMYRREGGDYEVMAKRARASLAGAMIEAATDPRYADQIDEALRFSKKYNLLGIKAGIVVGQAVKLVSVPI